MTKSMKSLDTMQCCGVACFRWDDPYTVEIIDQGRVKASDGLLTITGAVESDTGNYTCRVGNLDGTRSRSVWIVISGTPHLILYFTELFVILTRVTWCSVVG